MSISSFSASSPYSGNAALAVYPYGKEVVVVEFDGTIPGGRLSAELLPHPAYYNGLIMVGLAGGELTVGVDYAVHTLKTNDTIWILPMQAVGIERFTPDCRGWALFISSDFMIEHAEAPQNSKTIISYAEAKKNPLVAFEPGEMEQLHGQLRTIRERIAGSGHLFQKEVIAMACKMFYLDLGDFFMKKQHDRRVPASPRKTALYAQFLRLLSLHFKQHHEVSFYADKLCITPQYLSMLLREQSGQPASHWIHMALITEAKMLLRQTGESVQEIAYRLHFPDQSTFGKFFKKYTGISPAGFRREQGR